MKRDDDRLGLALGRHRRAQPPIVYRISSAQRPAWEETGELSLPPSTREEAVTEVPFAMEASVSREIAPVIPHAQLRAVGSWERWLWAGMACALLAAALSFAGRGVITSAAQLMGGVPREPWKEVAIHINSTPKQADAYIDDHQVGKTPTATYRPCRGGTLRIRVEAKGYETWQWNGTCPSEGPLSIRAALRRRE